MSITNDLVYSIIQPYFSLCPVQNLSDSILNFSFCRRARRRPQWVWKFGHLSILPFILTYITLYIKLDCGGDSLCICIKNIYAEVRTIAMQHLLWILWQVLVLCEHRGCSLFCFQHGYQSGTWSLFSANSKWHTSHASQVMQQERSELLALTSISQVKIKLVFSNENIMAMQIIL